MIQTLGLITGATLSLITTNQVAVHNLTVASPEATQTAVVSDFSPEHEVMSTFGAEVPQITLDASVDPLKPKEMPQKKVKSEDKSPIDLMLAHPLNPQTLFDLVNDHRVSIGLKAFEKDDNLCTIAESRLPELAEEIFGPTPMHEGLKTKSSEYWITENLIHVANEDRALEWWLNSPIHKRAIESTTYTHSCSACIGNSCSQLFTSFMPKKQG